MPEAWITVASHFHADQLAPKVRDADRLEMWSAYRQKPLRGLHNSLDLSTEAWAGYIGDELLCVFGVGPICVLTGRGMPWFLAADTIRRHQVAFLRRCDSVVNDMQAIYPTLENWVDARNTTSIRWLRWLGFALHPAEPFGFDQLPFHRFTKQVRKIACA